MHVQQQDMQLKIEWLQLTLKILGLVCFLINKITSSIWHYNYAKKMSIVCTCVDVNLVPLHQLWPLFCLISRPMHSQLFNVACWKVGGLGDMVRRKNLIVHEHNIWHKLALPPTQLSLYSLSAHTTVWNIEKLGMGLETRLAIIYITFVATS